MIDGGGSVTPTLVSHSVVKQVSIMKLGFIFYSLSYWKYLLNLCVCSAKKKKPTNSRAEGVSVRYNDAAGGVRG